MHKSLLIIAAIILFASPLALSYAPPQANSSPNIQAAAAPALAYTNWTSLVSFQIAGIDWNHNSIAVTTPGDQPESVPGGFPYYQAYNPYVAPVSSDEPGYFYYSADSGPVFSNGVVTFSFSFGVIQNSANHVPPGSLTLLISVITGQYTGIVNDANYNLPNDYSTIINGSYVPNTYTWVGTYNAFGWTNGTTLQNYLTYYPSSPGSTFGSVSLNSTEGFDLTINHDTYTVSSGHQYFFIHRSFLLLLLATAAKIATTRKGITINM